MTASTLWYHLAEQASGTPNRAHLYQGSVANPGVPGSLPPLSMAAPHRAIEAWVDVRLAWERPYAESTGPASMNRAVADEAPGGITYDRLRNAIESAVGPADYLHSPPSTAPQITVSMPAYNAASYIRDAVMSVLKQTGVRLELIVVDDASEDGTAAAVEAVGDARVTLLRNDCRQGIGYCHNRVVQHGRAPVVVHVDADDLILPGALAKALAAVEASPALGQAYANHFELDEAWQISVPEFERQRAFLLRVRAAPVDFRRDLLVHGMVTNPLRTYRKAALAEVGPFNETLKYGVDYEMAVRIADRFDMRLIPEFLYCQRVHRQNTQQTLRWRALRFWLVRLRICHDLLKRRQGRLVGRTRLQVYALHLLGLAHALQLPTLAKAVLRAPRRLARSGARG